MSSATSDLPDAVVFEVSTDSTDALRARITVLGELSVATLPLLTSAVGTHLRAGRRYLRVDVTAAHTGDTAVLYVLTELSDRVSAVGGMLVYEGAATGDLLATHVAGLRTRG